MTPGNGIYVEPSARTEETLYNPRPLASASAEARPVRRRDRMRTFRVYLDTNLISRIRDGRVTARDALALEQLSEFSRHIHYVTSDRLTNEVARTRDPRTRGVLLLLAATLEKVPWEIANLSGCIGGAPIGAVSDGGGWTHPIYAGLFKIFDEADAHHIFLAVQGGCDYFLTIDRRTIIDRLSSHTNRVAELCGRTKIVEPSELAEAVRSELRPD